MHLPRLNEAQRELVHAWFPRCVLVDDLAWGVIDTAVLRLRWGDVDVVVKASQSGNHHIQREITAHEQMLGPWAGRAPELLHADRELSVLATRYLHGRLVESDPVLRDDPEVHRQAGELLALLHDQGVELDDSYERRMDARAVEWLDGSHRIGAEAESRLRELLTDNRYAPARMVPTHGDWQPRNWLWRNRVVYVIDLGRAERRPAQTDLARLAYQQWRDQPELEEAFVAGYGGDPREPQTWKMVRVREAVGTAAWASRVGDAEYEEQGHRMIAEVLADLT